MNTESLKTVQNFSREYRYSTVYIYRLAKRGNLKSVTIDGVRFNSFEFSTPEKAGEEIKLTLKGVGSSFASIAFQSDVFGNSEQYGKNVKLSNPVLSDLVLDQAGNVEFAFTSTINPKDILFSKTLGVESTSTQP